MHFCVLATRGHGAFAVPKKYGLNWFIPALVNSSVGSSCGTTGDDGTNVCPCDFTKKSMNCRRMSAEVVAGAGGDWVSVMGGKLLISLRAGHYIPPDRPAGGRF